MSEKSENLGWGWSDLEHLAPRREQPAKTGSPAQVSESSENPPSSTPSFTVVRSDSVVSTKQINGQRPESLQKKDEAFVKETWAEFDRLIAAFVSESPIEHEESKRVLAEALASAVIRHRILFAEIVQGVAPANAQRTYPACLTQIQRLAKTLGVTAPKEHVPDFG